MAERQLPVFMHFAITLFEKKRHWEIAEVTVVNDNFSGDCLHQIILFSPIAIFPIFACRRALCLR